MKAEIHTQHRGYISQYNFRTSEKVSKIPEPTHHFMTKAKVWSNACVQGHFDVFLVLFYAV